MSTVSILSESPVSIGKLSRLSLTSLNGLPDSGGVYFAIDRGQRVWYVGLATSLRQRWMAHEYFEECHSNGVESIAWVEVSSDSARRELERSCIKFFRPPINDRMNHPDLPRIAFGLSPDQEVERFMRLQIQKRLIEMEIELLKPNLVSQCEGRTDGKITHYLGTISAQNYTTWTFSAEVDRLAKELKEQKAKEKANGSATVKGVKTSPIARVKAQKLNEATEIHFDDVLNEDESGEDQDLEAA